jgi:hypothetical protein
MSILAASKTLPANAAINGGHTARAIINVKIFPIVNNSKLKNGKKLHLHYHTFYILPFDEPFLLDIAHFLWGKI